jgi:hypothetical protein
MWKYFSKQVFINLLPDWSTFVGNALFHSLKQKGFQNNGQGGKQNWNIFVRKTSEWLQYLLGNIINVIKYDILIYDS